jgi:thiamine pyrophosphokinase
MIVYLIIGNHVDLAIWPFEKDALLFGVDRGAYQAVKSGLSLDLAYGDFDSVSKEELTLIRQKSKKVIQLNPIKDITDTYGAYLEAKEADRIVILGGIEGQRIEHFLAILSILKQDPRVLIADDSSRIANLPPRKEPYLFSSESGKFFSFFGNDEAVVTLEGFAYPLAHHLLKENDSLGISNQLASGEDKGRVFVEKGSLLSIVSKDDRSPLL